MVKPFYVDTTGAWVLGYNQEQWAGSHLQAGARAELINSPITKALSTFGGRIAAQTMQFMFRGNVKAVLNYAAFRPYAMMEAIKQALGDDRDGKLVIDPAGGYSPVLYWLAKEMPNTDFIEIDTEKMIEGKRTALEPFGIPPNFQLMPCNLTEKNLHEFQSERADVIVTLGAYVNHSDFRDMARYLKNILKDDGYLIAPFPNTVGIDNFLENSTVFTRIVASPKGAIESEDDLSSIFRDTGFKMSKVIHLSELAKKYGHATPADIEMIAIAQLGVDEKRALPRIDELDIFPELDDTDPEGSPLDSVPPFIDFDPETFMRFPRRQRNYPTKPKTDTDTD